MAELVRPADLLGQETAVRAFETALDSGRIAGAYLLHGPPGTGRALGASLFANALLCSNRPSAARASSGQGPGEVAPGGRSARPAATGAAPVRALTPCRTCSSCRWNAAGTHPDLLMISADTGPRFDDDADAGRAGVDRFTRAARVAAKAGPRKAIAVRALRRLLELLSLASAAGGWKVAIVDAFDEVEEEGTAALLKTLEEAPPRTTFLLLARDADSVPDTILSRCQRVRFRPLEPDLVRRITLSAGRDAAGALAPDALELIVRLAQGSPGRAITAARIGLAGVPREAAAGLGREPAPPDAVLAWLKEDAKDLEAQRERAREALALCLLRVRDTWAPGAAGAVGAIRGALESLDANVAPDLVLRGLWVRARRSTAMSG